MALQLSSKPQTLTLKLRPLRRLSSSTDPSSSAAANPTSAAAADEANRSGAGNSSDRGGFGDADRGGGGGGFFGDIKSRLRSPPPSQSPPSSAARSEFRDLLANFRKPNTASPSSPVPSFQQIFQNQSRPAAIPSLSSIRESIRNYAPNQNSNYNNLRDRLAPRDGPGSFIDKTDGGIFDKEKEDGGEVNSRRTDFLRQYTHQELGDRLRRLRPKGSDGDESFSITELNERLVKLRELEEKEDFQKSNGLSLHDLRKSLLTVKKSEEEKHRNQFKGLSILSGLSGSPTAPFLMKPPQEELLERFNHPDHMSSAEKMKLELKKTRDEFKMSESDCGSIRVQVAQLTTKIKHLSSTLHKKDKHSRRGLQQMIERRKKHLKYLRRTDWDSYCLTLSKLGLRDVPEYKKPNYPISEKKKKPVHKSKKKKRTIRKSRKPVPKTPIKPIPTSVEDSAALLS